MTGWMREGRVVGGFPNNSPSAVLDKLHLLFYSRLLLAFRSVDSASAWPEGGTSLRIGQFAEIGLTIGYESCTTFWV